VTLPFKHFIVIEHKTSKNPLGLGASFLVNAATFDHSLGILESNLEGGGQKKFP
jgi:hypothetical protein